VKLHAYEWGERGAPAIVCVHGLTAHAGRYRKLAEERLAARYHVLAPDLRGHGRSTWVPPWNLETFVGDLLETAQGAGIERAVWIGHSFGGRLVRELAASTPEAVERVVLLDPGGGNADPESLLVRAEALRADESFGSVEEAMESWRPTVRYAPEELLREGVTSYLERSPDGRYRFLYSQAARIAIMGELARPVTPYHGIPTLLVIAEESEIVTPEARDALAFQLGEDLEVTTVAGGHSVDLDAFEETAAAIERFLSDS
jgi:lipase